MWLNVDNLAFRETRIADTCSAKETNSWFIWHGLGLEYHRLHRIGQASNNESSTKSASSYKYLSSFLLSEIHGIVYFITTYAPTLASSSENKGKFHRHVESFYVNTWEKWRFHPYRIQCMTFDWPADVVKIIWALFIWMNEREKTQIITILLH